MIETTKAQVRGRRRMACDSLLSSGTILGTHACITRTVFKRDSNEPIRFQTMLVRRKVQIDSSGPSERSLRR